MGNVIGGEMAAGITVFIPVRNGAQFIERTIRSALEQTFNNLALVVTDNCSTDDTRLLISRYLEDKRLTLIERPRDIGMVANFNACLDAVRSKYFMFLCHNDYFVNNKALEAGFKVLERHPDVPAVHCDMVMVDEKGRSIINKRFGFSGLVESSFVARKTIVSGRNCYGIPLLVRSSAAQNAPFDETLPHSGDIDVCATLGKGKQIYYIPEVLIAIRFHRGNNAARVFTDMERQFRMISAKRSIPLSRVDKIRMKLSHRLVEIQKRLFFVHLDKLRK